MAPGNSSGSESKRKAMALPGAGSDGVLARLGNTVRQSEVFHKGKRAISNTARFSKKIIWSTGKAAWIAGTTFLVVGLPLLIEIDRDAQLAELEGHQASLLGAPSQPPGLAAMK
ncbi:hypothetical protein KP509_05G072400 [Ceratopteris richardii]|nr:hypothetical protein KP509_05G072400 [Ceratopteris richardii]